MTKIEFLMERRKWLERQYDFYRNEVSQNNDLLKMAAAGANDENNW